ncbi:MAG: Uma2 family endonuclease [Symploca sp. SIO2C1]|nr:Uma2 family endonuclease [Symploca sp. SIO2C1]
MLLELRRLTVPPGQRVLLEEVSWDEFERILEDLGEHRAARVAYDNGLLEIMTPLPEHEFSKESISDFVKALLEELDIEFLPLGSTTFKNKLMLKGIEPDNCFYIKNEAAVRGKARLDLTIDPPPDLALEIDITSRTHPNMYEALGVPELWRFENGELQINILQPDGKYARRERSRIFPDLPLMENLPKYVQKSKNIGRNKTMKLFRQWVRDSIVRN